MNDVISIGTRERVRPDHDPAGDTARAAGLPAWLCAVQLILAYEWLISGLNKILNPHFDAQLPAVLRQSIANNPYGWYTTLLQRIVLPHHALFAPLARLGETSVGLTLLVGAALWLWRPRSRATIYAGWAACLALLGAAFLALNYFFQGGTPLPWINPGNAYNPGVDIDILIPLLCLVLVIANVRALMASPVGAGRSC
ncbi:MAG: hypothetical protein JOZ41_07060 [Chloroflexi bacterium]|nr:hypothetical protein [Chloroflexota bacterium]